VKDHLTSILLQSIETWCSSHTVEWAGADTIRLWMEGKMREWRELLWDLSWVLLPTLSGMIELPLSS